MIIRLIFAISRERADAFRMNSESCSFPRLETKTGLKISKLKPWLRQFSQERLLQLQWARRFTAHLGVARNLAEEVYLKKQFNVAP